METILAGFRQFITHRKMKLICETMNEEEEEVTGLWENENKQTNTQNNKQKTQIKTLLQEPEL